MPTTARFPAPSSSPWARRAGAALAVLLALAGARPAAAGWVVSGSLGYGQQVAPEVRPEGANLLVALGYDFFGIVRPELGLAGGWEAARHGRADEAGLELRPMVVLGVPLLPLYARLVGAAVDPFTPEFSFAYGGGLGVALAVLGLGVFAEVEALPRGRSQAVAWVLEARAGVKYAF